jgi:branched-chain amino acid transport system substrate-binding protein
MMITWMRAAAGALTILASAGIARSEIVIGVAGPITGANAAFGAQLKNGAEMAVADLNAAGGVLGETFSIVIGDDVSDPKQGVSVANKMVGDGVSFVVGHFSSGVSIPASDVYAENGVLQVTPASTNPQFTERGLWNVVRICGRDDQQGVIASRHILETYAGKRIAILHDKTTYGQGLAEETRRGLQAGGNAEVFFEGVNIGEKDFSALVSRIKSEKIDLVYWGGLHTELGLLIRQLADSGARVTAMGADGIVSEEFAAIGGPATEGTLMTFPPDPRARDAARDVVDRFLAKGVNPEAYTLYSYAAVQVIAQAAEKAGSFDPEAVADAIRSGESFETVLGPIAFDDKGDRTSIDYVVYRWAPDDAGRITYQPVAAAP